MPKIFEYLGFVFFFYSNDHEPFHCHVKKGEKEVKVYFECIDGVLQTISIRKYNRSKHTFTPAERTKIRQFVSVYYLAIQQKWNDFRAGKQIITEKINTL